MSIRQTYSRTEHGLRVCRARPYSMLPWSRASVKNFHSTAVTTVGHLHCLNSVWYSVHAIWYSPPSASVLKVVEAFVISQFRITP